MQCCKHDANVSPDTNSLIAPVTCVKTVKVTFFAKLLLSGMVSMIFDLGQNYGRKILQIVKVWRHHQYPNMIIDQIENIITQEINK